MTKLQLIDKFGRVARDLRLSVVDRCNLRCIYCLPEKANKWIARNSLLTANECARLVRIGLNLGIKEVRITGGEPLLRPDLEEIVKKVAEEFKNRGIPPRLALTTNGINLEPRLENLISAGIERINISIDTLEAERFKVITRRPITQFNSLIAAIEAVASSQITPVKLNTVILDAATLEEIPHLVDYANQHGFEWRAIEFMPIGPLAHTVEKRPTQVDILNRLQQIYDLTPLETEVHAPAKRWKATSKTGDATNDLNPAVVGIIASTTAPFCQDCDRTRISANGKIYSCIFTNKSVDLLELLRSGASDQEIANLWMEATARKPFGQQTLPDLPPEYSMSQIGG